MTQEGPLTDVFGNVSERKIEIKFCEMFQELFKDVQIERVVVYRDLNNYPDGCELTLRSWGTTLAPVTPNIRITILGDTFKDLQKLILGTMGFDDADKIT